MEQREVSGMWGRYVLFIVLSFGILALNIFFNPPRPRKPQAERPEAVEQRVDGAAHAKEAKEEGGPAAPVERKGKPEPGAVDPGDEKTAPEGKEPFKPEEPAQEPKAEIPSRVPPKPRLITLGSLDPLDPRSPCSGLATFTNLGAALVRFELSSPNYRDLEHRHGYLGHSVLDEIGHLAPEEMRARAGSQGCLVDGVGRGTPADLAGLKRGDRITFFEGQQVIDLRSLRQALEETKPGDKVELKVSRHGETLTLSATLGRQPMEVIRPEKDDPLSFLCTLAKLGDRKLADLRAKVDQLKEKAEELKKKFDAFKKNGYAEVEGPKLAAFEDEFNELSEEFAHFRNGSVDGDAEVEFTDPEMAHLAIERLTEAIDDFGRLNLELPGLDLRTGAWDIENPEQFDQPGPHTAVTFFRELPELGLKISKTFRFELVAEGEKQDLVLDLKIENYGEKAREVAYQLDGPTGLPTEGSWYARKSGRGWGAVGLRDVVVSFEREVPSLVGCRKIANDDWGTVWRGRSVTYIGVDAQYFSAMLIPRKENGEDIWFAESQPVRVGAVNKTWKSITNTSCRVTSNDYTLKPGQSTPEQAFIVFAGPKKPALLAKYGLNELVYYGWFSPVAKFLLGILHLFHAIVGNYGLAIIMLTILVRGCMFPLSIKQARGAQKMQELQPEIKKLQEKYKNNAEAKIKAQQELFKKHNYNPLSGCLPVFLQFPIFIGLYRALMVDVELRQAPLLWGGVRWCSNLAAPDMLFDWSGFWTRIGWGWFNEGQGIFALGPYFNLLPLLTIALILIQQKMFMPPPTDDQAKFQQSMMKFMMIFMGLIFFKVASGLCLYFIASSLWGVAERKLLPKTSRPASGERSRTAKPGLAKPGRRIPSDPKPAMPRTPRAGSNHDGAGKSKKKKKKSGGRR